MLVACGQATLRRAWGIAALPLVRLAIASEVTQAWVTDVAKGCLGPVCKICNQNA